MINENIILRCEDSIEGMFTAVYDAFVYKNKIQKEKCNFNIHEKNNIRSDKIKKNTKKK